MVKRDYQTGRHYLEDHERLRVAPPSLADKYPGATFVIKSVLPVAEKGVNQG